MPLFSPDDWEDIKRGWHEEWKHNFLTVAVVLAMVGLIWLLRS